MSSKKRFYRFCLKKHSFKYIIIENEWVKEAKMVRIEKNSASNANVSLYSISVLSIRRCAVLTWVLFRFVPVFVCVLIAETLFCCTQSSESISPNMESNCRTRTELSPLLVESMPEYSMLLQATFYHKLRINCCYWLSNASEMPYRTRIRFDFVPLATIHTSTVRFWFFRCCLPLICNWTQNINIQNTNSLVQTFCHRHIGFCCCLLFICRCFGRDWIIEFVYRTKLQVHAYWSSDRNINRRHENKYGVWKSISQNCWNCRRRYKIYMKLNDKQMRYWWNLELFIFLETARETLIFWILIEHVRLERIERPGSFRNNKVTIWLLQLIHLSILSSSKNSQVYTKLSSTKTESSGHENSVFVLWLEFFIQFLINYQLNTETKAIQSF